MNVIFCFPVPFLMEPLNGLVNLFRDIFEGFVEMFHQFYFWIKEKFFGYKMPEIPEPPVSRVDKWKSRQNQDVLTAEEEEYLRRKFYQQKFSDTNEWVWYKDPILIMGGIIFISLVTFGGYYYYTHYGSNSGGGGDGGGNAEITLNDNRRGTNRIRDFWKFDVSRNT